MRQHRSTGAPVSDAELDRSIQAYFDNGGTVTKCPTMRAPIGLPVPLKHLRADIKRAANLYGRMIDIHTADEWDDENSGIR